MRIKYKLPIQFFILMVLLISACTKAPDKNRSEFVDLEKNISTFKQIHLSNIAADVTYISLETNEKSIIEWIKSIDFSGEYIFITTMNKCLLFNSKGRFISQIGRKGKGPGEYLRPGAATIGEDYLYVPADQNLLVFKKNGELIKSINSPTKFEIIPFNNGWFPISDSIFVCHVRNILGNEKNKAVVFDWNSDTVQLIPNQLKFQRKVRSFRSDDGRSIFYSFKNKIYFKEYVNDTLFLINKDFATEPSAVFHLGKYKLPNNLRSLSISGYFKIINEYIWITNVFETGKWFFLDCYFGDHYPFKKKEYNRNSKTVKGIAPVLVLHEKETDETFIVKPELDDDVNPNGIINDWDGGLSFYPHANVDDSTLVMIFSPYDLLRYISSDSFKNSEPEFPEKKQELMQMAQELDWNDNPVLMLVKLKE